MTLRIAMISEHASPLAALGGMDAGGQNVYVNETARRLARQGHQVDVFTRRDAAGVPAVVTVEPNFRVIHVDAGPPRPVPKECLHRYMPGFTAFVRAFAPDRPYDLIHAHFWMSAEVALDLKREWGIPVAVTFHALGRVRRAHQGDADSFPNARFAVEDRVIHEADLILAECPADRDDLLELYRADPARIAIVSCGVDLDAFRPGNRRAARVNLGLPPADHVVLAVTRMVPRKGVETAILAMAALAEAHPDARLVIVGGQSPDPDPLLTPEIGRLQQVAREAGVSGRVHFVGARGHEALAGYYQAADVFVTTPWYEPFGITPLEAMACGLPVIGSNVGGIKYTVRDGETGYLVPPRDPHALAARVSQLLSHPSLRAEMSSTARAHVAERFSWDRVVTGLLTAYCRLTGREADGPVDGVDAAFIDLERAVRLSRERLGGSIAAAAGAISDAFAAGKKLLVCGNGGSAADAQHFAAELVGRFQLPGRRALPAISLTGDAAVLTAWANDAGYEHIFSRQVEALALPADVVVGISTSGRSSNVVNALLQAHERGAVTVALSGGDGGPLAELADIAIVVPSDDTQRIQEVHTLLIHLISGLVEQSVAAPREFQAQQRPARRPAARHRSAGVRVA
jgi:phosphoheptose isomerase